MSLSFLKVRITQLLLIKSFTLFCICNNSVVEVSTTAGSLPADYMLSYADPVFWVSLHLLLRCSQTPHNSMFETKNFPDAKKIHLCTRIFYSSYADLDVAVFLNSHFASVSDELLHLHLLFLEKCFFDIFFALLLLHLR